MKIRSALLIATSALALTAGLLVPAAAGNATDRHGHGHATTTLRDLAKGKHIKIGSAVDVTALAGEADYRTVLNREFNNITAENAMKWETIEPQRGVFDWSGADAI